MFTRLIARLTFRRPPPVVAVVRLSGVIGRPGGFGSRLNITSTGAMIERAFRTPGLKAIALEINSPGGSPAQSALIHSRIRALAAERDVPVMAFVEDVAASGGYWLATAADEIFVDDNSIVGSIGVIYSGFGFTEAMEKLGIERRLYTAGDRKSLLDPFCPEKPEEVERLKSLQGEIHSNFKSLIKKRRGQRLTAPEDALFSGDVWLGARAVEAGLADGVGELRGVLRERYGARVIIKRLGQPRGWLRRRIGLQRGAGLDMSRGAESLAGGMIDAGLDALEARIWWGRYGL